MVQRHLLWHAAHNRTALYRREAVKAGEAFIAALPQHEFTIPRQLVADATITAVDHEIGAAAVLTLQAELLLLEEC